MTKINKFTDLEAWREAHKLTILVYRVTAKFPKEELYGLTTQLRRAVVSIESCIAEGFCRYHYKDRLNFYSIGVKPWAFSPRMKAVFDERKNLSTPV